MPVLNLASGKMLLLPNDPSKHLHIYHTIPKYHTSRIVWYLSGPSVSCLCECESNSNVGRWAISGSIAF